jgi:hypothetical protein
MVVLPDAAPVTQDAPARFVVKGTRSGGTAQVTQVVAEVAKVPVKSIHIVIREGRGLHYMFGGEAVPEYQPAGGG